MKLLILCSVWLLGPPPAGDLDTVTMLDGQVLVGYVESEDQDHVDFRVIQAGGKITYLRRLSRKHIRDLKRDPVRPPVALARQGKLPASVLERRSDLIIDKQVFLQTTIAEWEIRNVEEASLRLVRLINQSSPEDLIELEKLTRRILNRGLADLAADVHLTYSLQKAEDGYFRLYFVMPFHMKELHAELAAALGDTLAREVPLREAGGSSGERLRSELIAAWLDQPTRYDGRGLHAVTFSRQLTKAMGMNRELTRLGQALQRDQDEMLKLGRQYEKLRQLLKVVNRNKRARSPAVAGPRNVPP